ncbi:hypothetical protein HY230_07330 [Candidatus Acetothermia bacterium]|nr:hypothetical protein [Candidatus Acetothermia bacterium]
MKAFKTAYTIPFPPDVIIRIEHVIERGRVVEFVVQLEVKGKPVKRYDTAHGFAHIDRYNLKGKQKKERLYLGYNTALTFAELDIKQNWLIYRERFLRGEWP